MIDYSKYFVLRDDTSARVYELTEHSYYRALDLPTDTVRYTRCAPSNAAADYVPASKDAIHAALACTYHELCNGRSIDDLTSEFEYRDLDHIITRLWEGEGRFHQMDRAVSDFIAAYEKGLIKHPDMLADVFTYLMNLKQGYTCEEFDKYCDETVEYSHNLQDDKYSITSIQVSLMGYNPVQGKQDHWELNVRYNVLTTYESGGKVVVERQGTDVYIPVYAGVPDWAGIPHWNVDYVEILCKRLYRCSKRTAESKYKVVLSNSHSFFTDYDFQAEDLQDLFQAMGMKTDIEKL